MKRVTEYCQWQEYSTEKKDERGNRYRSYYYTKGWHSRIIPSLLFNQPFRHNNPQRNPFPSTETVAYYANAGQYKITQPVLERLQGYRWLYYDKDGLVNFGSSTAARLPGGEEFKPVGGGYFYSSYQQATSVLVARMVGMFFENSFNLQLGDLFSTCNAGKNFISVNNQGAGKIILTNTF
eukprot:TRINITY_DN413_c0_g1_i6.p1 TRINITY_DN413_c0_g1~~TRINITY_DN413_c0_g1_i6.p1  ORF type:complete len:180 (-),score=24.74 TRINITY_DN413_c0_g1_i6:961-1500(-)